MARRRGKKAEEAVATGPPRVLVVNDEPDACELLNRILLAAGYQVARAHDTLQMTAALTDRPHAVILDVSAGGIGGNLKLLDTIRGQQDPALAATRVVLCATNASNAMFSWQAGIDAFVLRPFHADELLAELAQVLARGDDDRPMARRRALDAAKTGSPRP